MLIPSTNIDQKSLETEFSIAICPLTGDKWQLKTLILAISDPHSTIVKSVFDCCLSCVIMNLQKEMKLVHTGKSICQFAGIYAYCRYFIYRKWYLLVLKLYRKTCHMPKGL